MIRLHWRRPHLFICLIGFLAFLTGKFQPMFSQVLPSEPLRFDMDYARFKTASDFVYLEVYYAMYRNQLKFVRDAEQKKLRADFLIVTQILQGDSVIVQDSIKNVTYATSLEEVKASQLLANLSKFVIREGNYILRTRVQDLHSGRYGVKEMELPIRQIGNDRLQISDIELGLRLNRVGERTGRFTKNYVQLIPNPSGVYGMELPILYFYAEIYNLQEGGEGTYRCRYSILDGNGNELREMYQRVKKKPGTSAVEAAGFNVISLRSGSYFFRVEIEDMDSHQRVSRLKKFFVYRAADFQPAEKTAAEPTLEDRLRSPEYQVYDTMTEAELDAEFDGASYIATSEDKKVFQGLDLAGKRQFLKRFWLLRDQNPGTPENEFRQEYLRRLQYVNRHFGTGKPGWKSDRGRIYLVYGKPDEVERFPSSGESRAYEVWHYYHIQGGVLFVFVDVRGFGDYILVHSTARNELHDENWERWIYVQ